MAQLKEIKAKLKEKSLPGAKVTNGAPSEMCARPLSCSLACAYVYLGELN